MSLLRSAVLLLPFAASACAQAQDTVRLPTGGGLDKDRVVELRYGKAAADAPVGPAAAADAKGPQAKAAARPPSIPGALATLVLENAGGKAGATVPLTFGQVFRPGALRPGDGLQAALADGSRLPLQADVKALHPDGSVRHVILSAALPQPAPGRTLAFGLLKAGRQEAAKPGKAPGNGLDAALRSGADATLQLTLDGKRYGAQLGQLLARARPTLWLDGPVVQEWHVLAPLTGPDGQPHPHLAAQFALRWYPGQEQARIDLAVENNWAYAPAPQNFTYDVRVTVDGREVYAKEALTHYHHARWRKLFWTGAEPGVHLRHDSAQLIDSLALPNYDRSVQVDERTLSRLVEKWRERSEPMETGAAVRSMGTTGGRPDIGLLPGWAAMYLLGMDRRAAEVTLGTATLAGSWPMHYRDQRTGLPASLTDYPYMARAGTPKGDAHNRATGKNEQFPPCPSREACEAPNKQDIAHHPGLSYLPYLLTGDHYHLEELQFWAMYAALASNPAYRQGGKGLLKQEQIRAQAWGLRTLGQAAYITPDRHPLKDDLRQVLDANLDWYNATYTRNREANRLGVVLKNGTESTYAKKRGIAPWQDDFFTSAVGHLAELGFDKARELLAWKARFPVARMTGDGACWITASAYAMTVREAPNAPLYASIGEAWRATAEDSWRDLPCGSDAMAAALKLRPGEMFGYSHSVVGHPSNLQPALAYAADALGEPGLKAWRQFMARSVKPDYGEGPQFAIIPRSLKQ